MDNRVITASGTEGAGTGGVGTEDVGARDAGAASVGRYMIAWANLEWSARMIITRHRKVLWGNDAALRLMQDGGDLRVGSGALVLADTAQMETFSAFIRRATVETSSWCYLRPAPDDPILFRAQLLPDKSTEEVIGLTFHAAGADFPMEWADFSPAFNLTPGEHRVVLRLLEGDDADSAADFLRLSIETVRTHIRHVYAKLGVGSREQLFRAVAPFRTL